MRAREFIINIPINIKFNGNGDPEVEIDSDSEVEPDELDQNPVFVPPLQQQIELSKASLGKESDVIDKITNDGIRSSESAPTEVGSPGKFVQR